MKKPLAIVTSDWHIHEFSEGGRPLKNWRIFRELGKANKKYQVPILFCGDMFHDPHRLTHKVLLKFITLYT